MKIPASEWKRKAVHAGMGLFALALRWLSWEQAALCALAAVAFNLFAIPRIGRGLYRDGSRRRDVGIVSYPLMVLLLVLLFRGDLAPIAAAVWAMMAFGDPAAAIFGKLVEGPRLPWNREKTWIGLLANWAFAATAAVLVFWFVASRLDPEAVLILTLGAGAFALLESVRSGLDDNLVAALPTALLLAWVSLPHPALPAARPGALLALAINLAVAAAAYAAGAVSASGAVGGIVAGTAILAAGGWGSYAVLWTFFAAGSVASRLGYREKEKRGTAQARRGRRGVEHVAANCLVGVLAALLSPFQAAWGHVFAAAFAAALADTLGTEFGSLYGRRAFSPLGGSLPVGTPGAVSWAGLGASAAGAALIAVVASVVGLVGPGAAWIAAVAGFVGALAESVANDLGRRFSFRLDHEFANALNTFIGAVVALEIAASLAKGSLCIPVES